MNMWNQTPPLATIKVKGIDQVVNRFANSGALSEGNRRSEVEVDPKRRCLRYDMSDLGLEAVEESCALGADGAQVDLSSGRAARALPSAGSAPLDFFYGDHP